MAIVLPRLIAIKSNVSGKYLRYVTEPEAAKGLVSDAEENVSSTFSRIEVEARHVDGPFVHLRFCNSNKYLARELGASGIRATLNKPEKTRSDPACTLFEPLRRVDGSMSFRHVQSGWLLATGGENARAVLVEEGVDDIRTGFTVVDLDTVVALPKYVTFKGDNGKYLRGTWIESKQYLQFSSEDGNELETGYEIIPTPDGHIRVKSMYFDKLWSPDATNTYILAVSSDKDDDKNLLFWPVKVSDNVFALRLAANGKFCKRYTAGVGQHLLAAIDNTITRFARLQVDELVFDRHIYVKFRMEDARIYDEKAIIAGIKSAENHTDEAASSTILFKYEDQRSSSFTANHFGAVRGVSTTFTTGTPFISKGKIEISAEMSFKYEWNSTVKETRSVEATYQAMVPPQSRVTVEYVGTVGKCDVPFSYIQRDRFSHDGRVVITELDDGVYTGVNYYSFHFTQPRTEPLSIISA